MSASPPKADISECLVWSDLLRWRKFFFKGLGKRDLKQVDF